MVNTENQEEKDCQWSRIKTLLSKIRQGYVEVEVKCLTDCSPKNYGVTGREGKETGGNKITLPQ